MSQPTSSSQPSSALTSLSAGSAAPQPSSAPSPTSLFIDLAALTAARDRYMQGAAELARSIASLQADRLATLGAADALDKLISAHTPAPLPAVAQGAPAAAASS